MYNLDMAESLEHEQSSRSTEKNMRRMANFSPRGLFIHSLMLRNSLACKQTLFKLGKQGPCRLFCFYKKTWYIFISCIRRIHAYTVVLGFSKLQLRLKFSGLKSCSQHLAAYFAENCLLWKLLVCLVQY